MNIAEFISLDCLKFAVITFERYRLDPIAQALSSYPVTFFVDGVEMVILSVPSDKIADLAGYAGTISNGVEYELTMGSNKVTLLTHEDALKLTPEAMPLEDDPNPLM